MVTVFAEKNFSVDRFARYVFRVSFREACYEQKKEVKKILIK